MATRTLEQQTHEGHMTEPGSGFGLPGLELSSIQEWRRELERLIGEHPIPVLAVSLGVGFLIGWWKKHK